MSILIIKKNYLLIFFLFRISRFLSRSNWTDTLPVPIGQTCPTITFSGIPNKRSSSPYNPASSN